MRLRRSWPAVTVSSCSRRLSTRDRIGQAKGIIMERYGVDDLKAFEMLRRLSQDSNTRLIDIAQRVIDTRGD